MSPPINRLDALFTPSAFTPTGEQNDVIQAVRNGQSLVVKAFAGTGKTATAIEAAKRAGRRGRMIVFNNAVRRETQARMPANVDVFTGHGLAHDRVIKTSPQYQKKLDYILKSPRQNLNPGLVDKHLNIQPRPDLSCTNRYLAACAIETLDAFLVSAAKTPGTEHVPAKTLPLPLRLSGDAEAQREFTHLVVHLTEQLWLDMANERHGFPITHDGYLKVLQLREPELSGSDELWLLDEYQDTNPVLDHLIAQQAGQKIYIGDPYQQIYSWRGAVNAMQNQIAAGAEVMPLSESFRFNHQIAGAANILMGALGERTPLRGQPYNLSQMDLGRYHTVLVRNNMTLLTAAAECLNLRQDVYVPGKLSTETRLKAESGLALFEGRLDDVKVGNLKTLGSWGALVDAAKTLEQEFPEYQQIVDLISHYRGRLPELIRACNADFDASRAPRRRVTLITTHRAKGKEWNYLRLTDDLALTDSIIEKLHSRQALTIYEREQVHLLYVALTRAKKAIHIPPAIKKNLASLAHLSIDPNQGKALAVPPRQGPLDPAEVRARTAAFIARHRATNR